METFSMTNNTKVDITADELYIALMGLIGAFNNDKTKEIAINFLSAKIAEANAKETNQA